MRRIHTLKKKKACNNITVRTKVPKARIKWYRFPGSRYVFRSLQQNKTFHSSIFVVLSNKTPLTPEQNSKMKEKKQYYAFKCTLNHWFLTMGELSSVGPQAPLRGPLKNVSLEPVARKDTRDIILLSRRCSETTQFPPFVGQMVKNLQ